MSQLLPGSIQPIQQMKTCFSMTIYFVSRCINITMQCIVKICALRQICIFDPDMSFMLYLVNAPGSYQNIDKHYYNFKTLKYHP